MLGAILLVVAVVLLVFILPCLFGPCSPFEVVRRADLKLLRTEAKRLRLRVSLLEQREAKLRANVQHSAAVIRQQAEQILEDVGARS